HVRDLPTKGKGVDPKQRAKEAAKTRKLSPKKKAEHKKRRAREQLIRRMGVDPDHGWKADYEILPGKEKVVLELKKLAAKADHIYLATDLDREGEAIAWHLREVIGGDDSKFSRVVFNEITKRAIQEAFESPGEIDIDRVNAQQARRFLDRVVGFELSPLLWAKVARGLSAGRVQSVAVRLVVERERDIRAFVPEEYWEAFADVARSADAAKAQPQIIRFQVFRDGGENFRPTNKTAADDAMARLEARSLAVTNRDDRPTHTKPNAPFITSTLQQAASTRLGFSVRKTMMLAQRLYEAGHITYMRTDSANLSSEAVDAVREHIGKSYGERYRPAQPNVYTSKEDAQEAHEAIRPSNIDTTVSDLDAKEADARKLYELIWNQFVACQMMPAEYLSSTITVQAGEFELRIRGRIMQFDGFTRVMKPNNDDDTPLPDLAVGEAVSLQGVEAIQHFTKPAPRYREASLVRELERRGIGRPSTYAAIISTIQDRGYVTLRNRRFYAEKIGELVTDRLVANFAELLDYSFTAEMEKELDQIAGGTRQWRNVLDVFYDDFGSKLASAQAEGGMRSNEPTETNVACSVCGRSMQVRTGSTGVFLGCSGYALPPKERCTHTVNLIEGDEVVDVDADDEGESKLLRAKRKCPTCATPMNSYLIDEAHKLHICGNNPDCAGFEIEEGEFRIKGYDGPVIDCDKCGAEMQLKSGRFGKYFGCTSTNCKNTRKLLRNGQPAPPKADPVDMPELACRKVDDHYVLRDGAAGIFLAASQFPKNRETRAPLISEIKPHAAELDPKFSYLLRAPEFDPEGLPTQVKYSRKTREQYVATEKEGKATGWRAYYRDGRWQEERPKPRASARRRKSA
ncbi:MAG: type I DNA topoisomerase, partial [Gammaproteobacteria bacterium]|nr:type I DNA topoisomerase [Gammaproteobacteria bacterium]